MVYQTGITATLIWSYGWTLERVEHVWGQGNIIWYMIIEILIWTWRPCRLEWRCRRRWGRPRRLAWREGSPAWRSWTALEDRRFQVQFMSTLGAWWYRVRSKELCSRTRNCRFSEWTSPPPATHKNYKERSCLVFCSPKGNSLGTAYPRPIIKMISLRSWRNRTRIPTSHWFVR